MIWWEQSWKISMGRLKMSSPFKLKQEMKNKEKLNLRIWKVFLKEKIQIQSNWK